MLIEEKAITVHQNVSQQAIAQMPQITISDPLHLTVIGQLTEAIIDEVAHPSQDGTLRVRRFWRVHFERSLQENPFASQKGLQIRKPIITIPQYYATRSLRQNQHDFCVGFIDRSQKYACQLAGPGQLCMDKGIKRRPVGPDDDDGTG